MPEKLNYKKYRILIKSILGIGTILSVLNTPILANAQDYPSRAITLVVGFPAGGSNDMVARAIAPQLSQQLGVPVVIENKPGANGTMATEYTAKAKPDGYTLTLGSASPIAISPHTYPKLRYNPLTDLVGITTVASTAELIAVNPNLPVNNLKDLVELSKKRDINIASSGNGGQPHLTIELLKSESKGRIVHVPYKGAAPGLMDAIGGQVDGIVVDIAPLYTSVQSNKLRAIAVTHAHRSKILPDVPTTAEAGLPKVLAFNWFTVMAPANTPKPIIEKLHTALIATVKSNEVQNKFSQSGMEVFTQSSPQEFQNFLKAELERWGEIAKSSGATASE